MLHLKQVKKSDKHLKMFMQQHYTNPGGFVGRSIQYLIYYNSDLYGAITGNSPIKHLIGRKYYIYSRYFAASNLDYIVNNQFFHLVRINGKYPISNFAWKVLKLFKQNISMDWKNKYNFTVAFFETLVEPPRTGHIYIRDGWDYLGMTRGFTCKRVAGIGTDNYSGKRVWNKDELKPKHIFMQANPFTFIPDNIKYRKFRFGK